MGRRRTIGQSRSAGAGRPCKHPQRVREYQPDGTRQFRIRCRRCGQYLLGTDESSPEPRHHTRIGS
jgi:hypothetical protein